MLADFTEEWTITHIEEVTLATFDTISEVLWNLYLKLEGDDNCYVNIVIKMTCVLSADSKHL